MYSKRCFSKKKIKKSRFYFQKIYTSILLLFFGSQSYSQVGLEWAFSMGSLDDDIGHSITVDTWGNVYTAGEFEGSVDFDPNIGISYLGALGLSDAFIQKLDSDGNLVWAKRFGGGAVDRVSAIVVDTLGNVYTTGHFEGTVDFDPNGGIYNLTSGGNGAFFVQKLDSDGNLVWAKGMGGTNSSSADGFAIALDNMGSVYTTGSFYNTVDFNPDGGVYNLTPIGKSDIFILKLDMNGTFVWAKRMGGTTNWDQGKSITTDGANNIYTIGRFGGTADFNPNGGVVNLTSAGDFDVFIEKLDVNGNFIWAKRIGGINNDAGHCIKIDPWGNVYITGDFYGTVDFNPNIGIDNLSSLQPNDIFIQKLDTAGNYFWTKHMGAVTAFDVNSLDLDADGNIFTIGGFVNTVDFDPSANTYNLTAAGMDVFVQKLDSAGNFLWAKGMGGTQFDYGYALAVDDIGNIYTTGRFEWISDYDPNVGMNNLTALGNSDIFVQKLNSKRISGRIYHDLNQNCLEEISDGILANRNLIINPGNIITTTNNCGYWSFDSLPSGVYSYTIDTSNNWSSNCPITQSFTVLHSDSFTIVPSAGLYSNSSCSAPNISIFAPFLRPGFSNQKLYVQACNQSAGLEILDSTSIIVKLDSFFTVQSASYPYNVLGNHSYQFIIDTIFPGKCINFWISCQLSNSARNGQTLCMSAKFSPIDYCFWDIIPNPYPLNGVSPCVLPYDNSSLEVESSCFNDSARFVIHNNGQPVFGDMTCFAPIRLYNDGILVFQDSLQLMGGDSVTYTFDGHGHTLRMEVNQHPLHLGNSNPNSTFAFCGDIFHWPSTLVNILPLDDFNSEIDIYCGLVTGSYDPNDKTGYPLGVGSTHDILPNQDLEYVIRFQNTGTDTAFTVVIRDTLSTDYDIFSVQSGVSSHDYSFKMYGPRVLEWTFNNIMLPDSNVNEPSSHGFVKFKVKLNPGLLNSTIIENSAAIYFDYNAPIITNTSWHTINENVFLITTDRIIEEQMLIKVYPNPTTSLVNIVKNDDLEISILVIDNLGRVLISKESSDSITQIDLSKIPSGIYYLSINNGKQKNTQKIIKQ